MRGSVRSVVGESVKITAFGVIQGAASSLPLIWMARSLIFGISDGEIKPAAAADAIEDLRSLDLARHSDEPLLDRVWALRENVSAYDAVSVALAEALDTILLTCDGRLGRTPGPASRIALI